MYIHSVSACLLIIVFFCPTRHATVPFRQIEQASDGLSRSLGAPISRRFKHLLEDSHEEAYYKLKGQAEQEPTVWWKRFLHLLLPSVLFCLFLSLQNDAVIESQMGQIQETFS